MPGLYQVARIFHIMIQLIPMPDATDQKKQNTKAHLPPGTKLIMKTFKYAAKATKSQHRLLYKILKMCAELYDHMRAEQQKKYADWRDNDGTPENKPYINQYTFQYDYKKDGLKSIDPFWDNLHSKIAQGVMSRLYKAYDRFFDGINDPSKKVGFPRAKKGRWKTIEIPVLYQPAYPNSQTSMVKIRKCNNSKKKDRYLAYLSIKGFPKIRFYVDQRLLQALKANPQCIRMIRVVRKARRLEVQLAVRILARESQRKLDPGNVMGMDMGVTNRVTTSDNEVVDSIKKDWKTKARLQRKMARRAPEPGKKASNGYKKAKREHRKFLEKEKEKLTNATHRLTTRWVKQYDGIGMEKLETQKMTRKGYGRSNRNKRILEQNWGEFRSMIGYKAENAGIRFELVNPAYTTRDCSHCGKRKTKKEMPLSQRVYRCAYCGLVLGRDHNAAINVCHRAFPYSAEPGGDSPGASVTRTNVRLVEQDVRLVAIQSPSGYGIVTPASDGVGSRPVGAEQYTGNIGSQVVNSDI